MIKRDKLGRFVSTKKATKKACACKSGKCKVAKKATVKPTKKTVKKTKKA